MVRLNFLANSFLIHAHLVVSLIYCPTCLIALYLPRPSLIFVCLCRPLYSLHLREAFFPAKKRRSYGQHHDCCAFMLRFCGESKPSLSF